MALAEKITALRGIDDPVAYQKKYRDEWAGEWEKGFPGDKKIKISGNVLKTLNDCEA